MIVEAAGTASLAEIQSVLEDGDCGSFLVHNFSRKIVSKLAKERFTDTDMGLYAPLHRCVSKGSNENNNFSTNVFVLRFKGIWLVLTIALNFLAGVDGVNTQTH